MKRILLTAVTACLFSTACTQASDTRKSLFTRKDLTDTNHYSETDEIHLSNENSSSTSADVKIADNTILITEPGTYFMRGEMTDGEIIVNVEDHEEVQLVLDHVSVSSSSSSPLQIQNAKKVYLTSTANSVNSFIHAGSETNASIQSTSDLTCNGNGTLLVKSLYGHGIASEEDLIITGGHYTIEASKQGLSGEKSIRIKDGTFEMRAEDVENNSQGFLYMENATFLSHD